MEYQNSNISENNFEQCTKCTICTAYCPVNAVNPLFPGPKESGPDGERYRLKDPKFYDEALKYCLNCKRCEVSCPSNVKIGDIIQAARLKYATGRPSLRDTMLANTDFVGSMATLAAPIVNATLGLKPVKKLMDVTLAIDDRRRFPKYAGEKFTTWYRRKAAARQARFDRQVNYFHGCYVNYNNPSLGRDLLTVLNAMGYGVQMLEKEKCCGVAKIANRLVKEAERDAKTNIASMEKAIEQNRAPILTTSSTCTFTMRDEYPHLLHLDNDKVRSSIMLATKFIFERVEAGDAELVFRPDFKMKAAYHTPCHMEKLGWTYYTLSVLRLIPGLDLTVLDSRCCGIAGTYGFKKEYYKYSQEIGQPLFDQIANVNPEMVVTDCETCKWQIEMSTGYNVENPITILARALDVAATADANGVEPPVV